MFELRRMRGAVLLVALLTLFAGCGPMPAPTPAPEATAPAPAPTAAGTAAAGTPAAAVLTLGALANRITAAWAGVSSYHLTFTGPTAAPPPAAGTPLARPEGTPGSTPVARPPTTFTSTREVILPDRQRQDVRGLGDNDHEAVAIGEEIYLRGPLTAQVAPGTPPDAWIAIDTATLAGDARLSQLLGGLPHLPPAPLAAVPERLWPQEVRDLGAVEFDGRQCQLYGAADTLTATGSRIDLSIAIDGDDLPCFIETSVGGVTQGRDEYRAINAAAAIEAPSATPVSVPPALASPAAQD